MQPLITICLVYFDELEYLKPCLDSIDAQTIRNHCEVIVLSNGKQVIPPWLMLNGVKWIHAGSNLGFGTAVDYISGFAKGRYLFPLNTDTKLHPDCLRQLYWTASAYGSAVTGPKVVDYDTHHMHPSFGDGFDLFGQSVSRAKPKRLQVWSAAAFSLIDTKVFAKLGGFDPDYFLYGEELDLCWRVWLSGERVEYCPSAIVYHKGSVAIKHKASPVDRFKRRELGNSHFLSTVAKNASGIMMAFLAMGLLLFAAEGLIGCFLWGPRFFTASFVSPARYVWSMRVNIKRWRARNKRIRQRSDWYLVYHFLRPFAFGRAGFYKYIT